MQKFLNSSLLKNFFSTTQASGKSLGFIGLGNMGSGMVRNLKKENIDVKIYDVMPQTREQFKQEGFDVANSVKDMIQSVDRVILMVPASQHVKALCEDEDGIFQSGKKGFQIIDCSTIGPIASKEMYQKAKKHGMEFIDAPVSGGVTGAANGTLTFMVGPENEEQFSEIKPILEPMARNIFNCKKPSGGQITKAVNNMALAIQMESVAEAMSLGMKMGMDEKVLSDVMNTATGQCWALTNMNPVPGMIDGIPPSQNYEGGFACELMLKDLGLALQSAEAIKADVPLGSKAAEIYSDLVDNGHNRKDYSYVYQRLMQ